MPGATKHINQVAINGGGNHRAFATHGIVMPCNPGMSPSFCSSGKVIRDNYFSISALFHGNCKVACDRKTRVTCATGLGFPNRFRRVGFPIGIDFWAGNHTIEVAIAVIGKIFRTNNDRNGFEFYLRGISTMLCDFIFPWFLPAPNDFWFNIAIEFQFFNCAIISRTNNCNDFNF